MSFGINGDYNKKQIQGLKFGQATSTPKAAATDTKSTGSDSLNKSVFTEGKTQTTSSVNARNNKTTSTTKGYGNAGAYAMQSRINRGSSSIGVSAGGSQMTAWDLAYQEQMKDAQMNAIKQGVRQQYTAGTVQNVSTALKDAGSVIGSAITSIFGKKKAADGAAQQTAAKDAAAVDNASTSAAAKDAKATTDTDKAAVGTQNENDKLATTQATTAKDKAVTQEQTAKTQLNEATNKKEAADQKVTTTKEAVGKAETSLTTANQNLESAKANLQAVRAAAQAAQAAGGVYDSSAVARAEAQVRQAETEQKNAQKALDDAKKAHEEAVKEQGAAEKALKQAEDDLKKATTARENATESLETAKQNQAISTEALGSLTRTSEEAARKITQLEQQEQNQGGGSTPGIATSKPETSRSATGTTREETAEQQERELNLKIQSMMQNLSNIPDGDSTIIGNDVFAKDSAGNIQINGKTISKDDQASLEAAIKQSLVKAARSEQA